MKVNSFFYDQMKYFDSIKGSGVAARGRIKPTSTHPSSVEESDASDSEDVAESSDSDSSVDEEIVTTTESSDDESSTPDTQE